MGLVKKKAVIITDLCEECGICNDVCTLGAVRFELPSLEFRPPHEAYRAVVR
jgi:ferredoxin